MDKGVILLGLYVVGAVVFIALYSAQKLYNSFVMGVLWPLTAPFIIAFLLFFSVKASAKKVMKKITETEDNKNAAKETAIAKRDSENLDSKTPQKIVYIYMTKPDVDTPMPANKSKQRINKKVQQPKQDEFDDVVDVVFEEANPQKQEEKRG